MLLTVLSSISPSRPTFLHVIPGTWLGRFRAEELWAFGVRVLHRWNTSIKGAFLYGGGEAVYFVIPSLNMHADGARGSMEWTVGF